MSVAMSSGQWIAGRAAASGEGVVMPRSLTAENGAKAVLLGEFSESVIVECPECNGSGEIDRPWHGSDPCESCDEGKVKQDVPVSWTTIKAIYAAAVKHFHPEDAA